jgi:hypothetical protein
LYNLFKKGKYTFSLKFAKSFLYLYDNNFPFLRSLRFICLKTQAYGILSALLSTINAKEALSVTCDYFAVFDFMADHLVADIFA